MKKEKHNENSPHCNLYVLLNTTAPAPVEEVIARLNEMGEYLKTEVGVTNWTIAKHIPESFREGRAHLLQDGIFPNVESLSLHSNSEAHKRVVELTPKVCDWMTVDTVVNDI